MRRPFLLLLAAGLPACGSLSTGKACSGGPGVSNGGYNGADMGPKQVTLTFDGGPGAATGLIQDYLDGSGIQGAFFVAGGKVAGNHGVLQSLKDHGHLIGNHTYSEEPLSKAGDPVTEVRKTDELILPYVTGNMFLLRAPKRDLPPAVADRLNQAGLGRYVGDVRADFGAETLGLTVDADCWAAGTPADTCAVGYLTAIRKLQRGIVQLNSERIETLALLKVLVPALKTEGYSFVRLDGAQDLQRALVQSGATTGLTGGPAGCSEY